MRHKKKIPCVVYTTALLLTCVPSHCQLCCQGFGAGFGAFFGVLKEAYSNPPTPTPSDKVILKPVKSDRVVRTMQAMGRNAAMMAVVAGVFTAAEVHRCRYLRSIQNYPKFPE